jgi:hypothetical protein
MGPFRILSIGLVSLSLTACQTTTTVSPSASSKLQTAGYQPLTARGGSLNSPTRFVCSLEKCGFKGAIIFGPVANISAGQGPNSEEMIRKRIMNDDQLRPIFQMRFNSSNSGFTFTSVRQFSTPGEAGFLFSAVGAGDQGEPIHVRGRAVYVGDASQAVISMAENPATAERGLSLALSQ